LQSKASVVDHCATYEPDLSSLRRPQHGHDRTTIYAIRRGVVTRLLSERPAFAQTALQALAADTREIITLAKDLALYHVNERVARLLLDQERCTCERCRNHNMTQQEMAAIVGAAREMVGRTLHEF
jgi:CRP-like cAMP-binding protein